MQRYNQTRIKEIANAMVSGKSKRFSSGVFSRPTDEIAGIYTYIGQMISHDIVPNTNPFSASRKVGPFLSLESLYGDFPEREFLYNQLNNPFMESHLFKLIRRENSDKSLFIDDFDRLFDGKQFRAIVPEARNDENVILAQLHILWLKFHNKLINEKLVFTAWEARQIVVLFFQLVVVNEFLKKFLHESVFDAYFEEGKSYFSEWDKQTIPTFFSHAAFRFGHSSVRSSYRLRKVNESSVGRTTGKLFKKGLRLDPKFKIIWSDFFPERFLTNNAFKIDTKFSLAMTKINELNPLHPAADVLVRNIEAGFNVGLPSGGEFIRLLKSENRETSLESTLGLEEISIPDTSPLSVVQGLKAEDLPLWIYILLEAETTKDGEMLGVLGSILVSEVLRNSIQKSSISIYENSNFQVSERALKKMDLLSCFIDIRSGKSVLKQIIDFVE